MTALATELRRGLARAAPYLLAHHPPSEFHRCHTLSLFGRRVRLCARCTGIYPGIVAGLLVASAPLWVVAMLPLPALVEWMATGLEARRGHNLVRTATGALLGVGYGLGLAMLVAGTVGVLAIGTAYAVVAGGLLLAERRRASA